MFFDHSAQPRQADESAPYRYAGGDPLNRVDPAGLYAIDVHYYMTYFLALTAGLDDKTAWVVATAAQTIDDVNPYPGRGTLTEWVRERYPETRKSVVGKAGRPSASLTSKQAAVYELCTREGSALAVAQKLDVDRVALYNWKNQLLGREASASMKRDKRSTAGADRTELERQVESLRRDIRNLPLEHDLLKKANEILKKDLGVSLQLLSNREKTTLVDALRAEYARPELLGRLDLARSSYFYHRSRLEVADKYAEVRRTINDIFESNHRSYGYRRIQASLNKRRVFVSEKVVQRLMKQEHLQAARPKRRGYRSYVGEITPAPENIVNRDFHAASPNEKWLNEEIKRRTLVVRIFPNTESCLRLIRALCVETHETWLEDNRYLNMTFLAEQKKELLRLTA